MNLPAAPRPTAFGGVCPAERAVVDTPAGPPQPGAPPDALFAALLDTQTARTAPADGQTTEAPDTAAATQPMDATVLDELAAAQPLLAGEAKPPAPKIQAPATPATPATPAVPAHPAALEPIATGPAPKAAPQPDVRPDANAEPAPKTQTATPAIPAPAKPRPVTDEPPKPAAKDQPAPAPAAKEAAPTPQPQPAVAPVKERPVVHSAPEPRPVLRGERVEALVRVATRHGAAEARMELHPQELGSVVVKLRVTSEGLSATFTASSPEAIPQLQQAGEDLRRSLEAKGLTLATLEVRAQGDDAGRAGERRHGHGGGHHRADHRQAPDGDDEPITSTTTTVPAGALVDVHA